jgi:hypothetical protein
MSQKSKEQVNSFGFSKEKRAKDFGQTGRRSKTEAEIKVAHHRSRT